MTRGKKVLIVEDHRESCLWISAVIRQSGYQTAEAGDGAVAVRLAMQELPDLILLDIHLPGGSGYFVMESLRMAEETKHIPVIIMTGDLELDQEDLRKMGAAATFKKPMDVHAFLRTIKTVIDNAASEATADAIMA